MVLKDIGSHVVTSGMTSKHPKSETRLDWGAFLLLPCMTDNGAAVLSNVSLACPHHLQPIYAELNPPHPKSLGQRL